MEQRGQSVLNEVGALALSANHVNIIQSCKPYSYATSLWIITEYMDISAAELIQTETLSEGLVAFLSQQCCSGLEFLHRKGIIRRNVQAAHIFLNRRGQVKLGAPCPHRRAELRDLTNMHDLFILAGFGRCEVLGSERTTTGTVGMEQWMAPEVMSGDEYAAPADIWSLGMTAIGKWDRCFLCGVAKSLIVIHRAV